MTTIEALLEVNAEEVIVERGVGRRVAHRGPLSLRGAGAQRLLTMMREEPEWMPFQDPCGLCPPTTRNDFGMKLSL